MNQLITGERFLGEIMHHEVKNETIGRAQSSDVSGRSSMMDEQVAAQAARVLEQMLILNDHYGDWIARHRCELSVTIRQCASALHALAQENRDAA